MSILHHYSDNCFINAKSGWYRYLFIVLVSGIFLRFAYFMQEAANPLLYMPVLDEKYYIDMGKMISRGYLLGGDTAFFMDPLYGYLLGLVFYLFGDNLTTIRLFQILIDSSNILIIFFICSKLFNRKVALTSAFLYAVYKVSFFYSLLILKTTTAVTFSSLFILILCHTVDSRKKFSWYIPGLVCGFLVLLRANLILLAPLTIFCYIYLNRHEKSRAIKRSVIFLAGLFTIISIFAVRNYYVTGEWHLLNSQSGRLLYCSNNQGNLTGRYNVPDFASPDPVLSEHDFHTEAESRLNKKLTSKEASGYWRDQTIRFLSDNPRLVPVLLFNKFKGSIGNCEIPNVHSFRAASAFSDLLKLPFPGFAFILALGIPGLFIGVSKNRNAAFLLIPVAGIMVTMIIFYTSSRLRMPMVPFLIIGSGIYSVSIIEYLRRKNFVAVSACLAVSFILAASSLSVSCPADSGNDEFLLSKAFWYTGEYNKSKEVADKAVMKYPDQQRFNLLLGMICYSEKKYNEALVYYKKVIVHEPKNIDALFDTGLLHFDAGNNLQAMEFLSKALHLERRPDILFYAGRVCESRGDVKNALSYYIECLGKSKEWDDFFKMSKERMEYLHRAGKTY